MATRTLVVDDDPQLGELLSTVFGLAGHTVQMATTVTEAKACLRDVTPDLAVVDLGLPDGSGVNLVAEIAARAPATAIIVVTADEREDEHVKGLRLGADDVISKPFRVANLLARVEAVMRRRGASADGIVRIDDLEIDDAAVTVSRGGTVIELTATEFRLLACLARNRARVVSKPQLLEEVWGYDFGGDGAVVERFVSTLRRKLGEPDLVHTVRGFGYMLREVP